MASPSDSDNFSTIAVNDDEAVKFGFKRSEMYQSDLAGTVDPYDRHVFLCYKSHEAWPARVEGSDSDLLPKLLAAALKARKSDIKVKTRLTICEACDQLELSEGDVLIFPEMIKYRNLKEPDVDGFVEDVLVKENVWAAGLQEPLKGSYVFVCAHNLRDRRCGVCGPVLIDKFKEEIESRILKSQIFVTACSHIGGHKYAGNVIIFSADAEGKVQGHWYGYVTPDDIHELLDQHILKREVIERIWRGKMGAPIQKTESISDQKLANGTNVNNHEEKLQEKKIGEEVGQSTSSCCQGANGFSCCRDGNSEERGGKLSKWVGKWEQRDVLTAVGILGAVAAVAVVYGFYRMPK